MNRAFSLIELIFAIVIISIALLSVPTLFSMVTKGTQEAIKIEAIYQASRTMGTILTYAWDENTPSSNTGFSYILDVTNGDNECNRVTSTRYRTANFNNKATRKFYPNATYASSTLGQEGSYTNDIDDFHNKSETITKSSNDIILDMQLQTKIFYISDNANYTASTINFNIATSPTSASTNIKMIEINLTNPNDNKEILVFRAFSCNIGEAKLSYKDL